MIKIEAIIQLFRLDSVLVALNELGIHRITISHVLDHSGATGLKTVYRGAEYFVDAPRAKLELLVSSLQTDEVIDAIVRAARTDGQSDDGTILITELADAISVHTGERVRSTIT